MALLTPFADRARSRALGIAGLILIRAALAQAEPLASDSQLEPPTAANAPKAEAREHPKVLLERVELPPELRSPSMEKKLRKWFQREARRADWGAGSDSQIQVRLKVVALSVVQKKDAIVVRCEVSGRLPSGRPARSQLAFGGAPSAQSKLIDQVLQLVTRGVVTRLAEMERVRRGRQRPAQVRVPEADAQVP